MARESRSLASARMARATALRSFSADDFTLDALRARESTVAVCLPARDEAETVGAVLEPIVGLLHDGLIDQVAVVVDGEDGTAEAAERAGAEVLRADTLEPSAGPSLGKGDAVWRAIPALRGEIVVLLDADLTNVDDSYVRGLAGPLLADPALQLVKGSFVRPSSAGGVERPVGGGRVTELLARPVLSLFYPELAALHQPLSGQVGVRHDWLAALPVWTGYALEMGMLLETYKRAGLEAIAEVDLGVLVNASQPLADLGPMAYSVLLAVARQLEREGRLEEAGNPPFVSLAGAIEVEPVERPPRSG
jgi:glucosyl-3-phosphoglycerate synthase